MATSQLITRSCRHMVNSAPVNSSHTRLVTQSTRHIIKPPQCWAVQFRCLGLMSLYKYRMISDNSYLWALKLERTETLHMHVQHGKLLQRVQCRSHWRRRSSWMRRMLGQTVRSTHHTAVRYDGQLSTPFYSVMSWLVGNRTLRTQDTSVPRHFGTSAEVSRRHTVRPQDTSAPRHFGTSEWTFWH